MKMNQQTYNNIMAAAERMEATDDLMTEALVALEANDWLAAYDKAQQVLEISDGIEQRLAALYIQDLANMQDHKTTIKILETAYDIDHRRDDLIEKNKAAYAELENAVNDFIANLQRIQAKL
jgi:hypothetical protein